MNNAYSVKWLELRLAKGSLALVGSPKPYGGGLNTFPDKQVVVSYILRHAGVQLDREAHSLSCWSTAVRAVDYGRSAPIRSCMASGLSSRHIQKYIS